MRLLKSKGWLITNPEGTLIISAKADKLVKELEGMFKRANKKTNKAVMGEDFEDRMKAYNEMWPKRKLPSGKAARSALRNIEPCFRWFFENYDYTWDQVARATALYLDEKEKDNWNFCRNSQYFIRKQNTDKTWQSELADYCQLIEDGGDVPDAPHFSENVF